MRQAYKFTIVLVTAAVVSIAGVGAAHAAPHDDTAGGAAGCCKIFF